MDTDSILPFLLSDPCESVFIRGYQFSSYFFLHSLRAGIPACEFNRLKCSRIIGRANGIVQTRLVLLIYRWVICYFSTMRNITGNAFFLKCYCFSFRIKNISVKVLCGRFL